MYSTIRQRCSGFLSAIQRCLSGPCLALGLLGAVPCALAATEPAASPTSPHIPASPHIQILAASCAACHGPNGNSAGTTPTLAGLEHDYFVLQMNAFRNGERSATVMQRHAKGLTPDEIELLAQYFSQQKRMPAASPPSQIMDAHHDE